MDAVFSGIWALKIKENPKYVNTHVASVWVTNTYMDPAQLVLWLPIALI